MSLSPQRCGVKKTRRNLKEKPPRWLFWGLGRGVGGGERHPITNWPGVTCFALTEGQTIQVQTNPGPCLCLIRWPEPAASLSRAVFLSIQWGLVRMACEDAPALLFCNSLCLSLQFPPLLHSFQILHFLKISMRVEPKPLTLLESNPAYHLFTHSFLSL